MCERDFCILDTFPHVGAVAGTVQALCRHCAGTVWALCGHWRSVAARTPDEHIGCMQGEKKESEAVIDA